MYTMRMSRYTTDALQVVLYMFLYDAHEQVYCWCLTSCTVYVYDAHEQAVYSVYSQKKDLARQQFPLITSHKDMNQWLNPMLPFYKRYVSCCMIAKLLAASIFLTSLTIHVHCSSSKRFVFTAAWSCSNRLQKQGKVELFDNLQLLCMCTYFHAKCRNTDYIGYPSSLVTSKVSETFRQICLWLHQVRMTEEYRRQLAWCCIRVF